MSRLPGRVAALLLGLLVEVGAGGRVVPSAAPLECALGARTIPGTEGGAVPICPGKTIWENPKGRAVQSHSFADMHTFLCWKL